MTTVPRICHGGTVAILSSGPSLTPEDAEYVRGRVDAVIAVNTTYQMAPWADCLYGSDGHKFWTWYKGVPDFSGLKYTLRNNAFDVPVLENTGQIGLELKPTGLRTGLNSSYAAINLAVHFGAKRIVLLGVDMKLGPKGEKHWHPDHPQVDSDRAKYFLMCLELFKTIVQPLKDAGVEVVNCSRDSALTVFPRLPMEKALPAVLQKSA